MNSVTSWIEAQGGLVGLGVEIAKYSLILFSIISLAVVVERVLVLRRLQRAETAYYPQVRDSLAKKSLVRARLSARLGARSPGDDSALVPSVAPCMAIARAGSENPLRVREAMERETTLQIAALTFNLPILASAASTAPYIGLFGTVLGILAAFREISRSGITGTNIVAGGISEALTATALGLGVAIPAVLAYNYFTGRVNALALQIETHAEVLAGLLEDRTAEQTAEQTEQAEVSLDARS